MAALVIAVAPPVTTVAQEGAVATSDEAFVEAIMMLYEAERIPARFREDAEAFIAEKLTWERDKIVAARRVIERTNRTASWSTWIVHGAVVIGFVLALLEFLHSWKLRRDGAEMEDHEVRVGLEGVAVKTSLHGLLILLVASGVYLMYLKFVYPIQGVSP